MNMKFDKTVYAILEEFSGIELDSAYGIFKNSYLKSTGTSWDKEKFLRRAANWKFYGDSNGYIAVRPQKSGFYKLVGTAGSLKSIYKGFQEIKSMNFPIWGLVSKDIANMLIKSNFRSPNEEEIEKLREVANNYNILGDAKILEILPDNGIKIQFPDIGIVTKYFVASEIYYDFLKSLT